MDCARCETRNCADCEEANAFRSELPPLYGDEETRRIAVAARQIESTYYGKACRLEEVILFAKEMGYEKLGVAFCVGLREETRTLVELLEKHFEVSSACCMVCGLTRAEAGILPPGESGTGGTTCNPIGQARALQRDGTQLNVIVGLCIGHDVLFAKYSHAPVTTLVVKDRVLAHNPVGSLYCRYVRRRIETLALK